MRKLHKLVVHDGLAKGPLRKLDGTVDHLGTARELLKAAYAERRTVNPFAPERRTRKA